MPRSGLIIQNLEAHYNQTGTTWLDCHREHHLSPIQELRYAFGGGALEYCPYRAWMLQVDQAVLS